MVCFRVYLNGCLKIEVRPTLPSGICTPGRQARLHAATVRLCGLGGRRGGDVVRRGRNLAGEAGRAQVGHRRQRRRLPSAAPLSVSVQLPRTPGVISYVVTAEPGVHVRRAAAS